MTRETLHNNIENLTLRLIKLADDYCWNAISSNLTFIVSDFNEFGSDPFKIRQIRNKVNKSKKPQSLKTAIEVMIQEYDDLYDINLYIFKALKNETIIEIQYYRRSNMDPDYFQVIKDDPTIYHAKIAHPKYRLEGEKFDVNWESRGWIHLWNSVIYEYRYRKIMRGFKRN